MKLTAENYELLIKAEASKIATFARPDGTSLSFRYMRETCNRLIEISNEYEVEFPKEANKTYGE